MNGRPWTDAERVLCARLERAGVSVRQIAEAVGRTECATASQAPDNRVVARRVTGERFDKPRKNAARRVLGEGEMARARELAEGAVWHDGDPYPPLRAPSRPRVVHLPLDPVPEPRPRVPAMPRNCADELDRLVAEGERRTREYRSREEGRR